MPGGSTIDLHADRIIIHDVTLRDPTAVTSARDHVGRGGDPLTWLTTVIGIGSRALRDAATTTGASDTRAGLDQLASDVTAAITAQVAQLGDRLDGLAQLSSERVGVVVEQQVTRLGGGVRAVLAEADTGLRGQVDSVLRDGLQAAVSAVSQTARAEAETTRAALERDASGIRQAVSSGLSDVRALLSAEQARAQALSTGPVAGRSYEQVVYEVLDGLANAAGDRCVRVGDDRGLDGSKKGDVLVTVGEPAAHGHAVHIAVEAKDTKVTSRHVHDLEQALVARDAIAGLIVTSSPENNLNRRRLHVLGPLRMSVAWQPGDEPGLLAAVLALLRAQAVATLVARHSGGANVAEARQHLDAAVAALTELDRAERAAAAIRGQADTISASVQRVRVRVSAETSRAVELLKGNHDFATSVTDRPAA